MRGVTVVRLLMLACVFMAVAFIFRAGSPETTAEWLLCSIIFLLVALVIGGLGDD